MFRPSHRMNVSIYLNTSQFWSNEVTVETRQSCQQEKIQYQIKRWHHQGNWVLIDNSVILLSDVQ